MLASQGSPATKLPATVLQMEVMCGAKAAMAGLLSKAQVEVEVKETRARTRNVDLRW